MAGPDEIAGSLAQLPPGERDKVLEYLRDLETRLDRTAESSNRANDSLGRFFSLGSKASRIRDEWGTVSTAFEDLTGKVTATNSAITALSAAGASKLLKGIPGVGVMAGMVSGIMKANQGLQLMTKGSMALARELTDLFDKPSEDMRMFDNQMYNVGRRFGGAHEEAVKFADSLKEETASQFARGMHMTRDEMGQFIDATRNTSLSLEQLNKSVDTGLGVTKLYAVASAQASAMNISQSQAAGMLNTLMNKQGRSAQDATEMMGAYSSIAEKTGITTTNVANTLNSAIAGFEQLGLAADFGRPILEGFGNVMDDMGLGIENATQLTTTLTQALAGLTTNYANAYIMMQKGGLDMGAGGGVLGASIGMQAAMLDAEKTGDQAAIGEQLVSGLKGTLESFTGGDIVTVQQAAESPELQNQFYVQQQMLSKQFGISDPKQATRVLDLLAGLDEATKAGDADSKAELQKQLANEMDGRDKTLGEWDKANRQLEIQSNLLAVIARPTLTQAKKFAAAGIEKTVSPAIEAAGGQVQEYAASGQQSLFNFLKARGLIDEDDSIYQTLAAQDNPPPSGATGAVTELDERQQRRRALRSTAVTRAARFIPEVEGERSPGAANQESGRDSDSQGRPVHITIDLTSEASEVVRLSQDTQNRLSGGAG